MDAQPVYNRFARVMDMKRNLPIIAKLLVLCFLLLMLANCGHNENETVIVTGPGLVGLDDSSNQTAPLLTVTYTSPTFGSQTVQILSDLLSDGDIEYDPVTGTLTVTQSPSEDFFGVDSNNPDQPEFRAFHTFVLDGSTGQPIVPSDATITSATVNVIVDEVDFADTVPTFMDLIQYQPRNLSPSDFDAPLVTSTSYRAFDFYSSDQGFPVDIDVTDMLNLNLTTVYPYFQVRYDLQSLAASPSRGIAINAKRSVNKTPRDMNKITPRQNTEK